MNLLDLPDVVLIEIFEHLSYEEVSKKRLVCQRFDQLCQKVLNCGFNKVIHEHGKNFKRIKALLPRRESERRNHFLARHADILTCIETRISMLSMTYTKYIDLNMCCFIPGRVLDEIFHVLKTVKKPAKPLRPHEILQELRDISSMAIEHFDEKIAINFKNSFIENHSKFVESGRTIGSTGLADISFNGASTSSKWKTTTTTTINDINSNSRCCETMIQRVSTLLTLGRQRQLQHQQQLQQHQGQPPQTDHNNSDDTMRYIKKLETDYKKGLLKMQRMQLIQNQQSRRLQKAISTVSALTTEINELMKRLEDIDAKNRELSENMKQMTADKLTAATTNVEIVSKTVTTIVTPAQDRIAGTTTATKRHMEDNTIANVQATDDVDIITAGCSNAKRSKAEVTLCPFRIENETSSTICPQVHSKVQ